MSIFISIASYQDPLLVSTIFSAYENAENKNDLIFSKNETAMSDKDSFVYGVLSSLKQKIDSPKRNK